MVVGLANYLGGSLYEILGGDRAYARAEGRLVSYEVSTDRTITLPNPFPSAQHHKFFMGGPVIYLVNPKVDSTADLIVEDWRSNSIGTLTPGHVGVISFGGDTLNINEFVQDEVIGYYVMAIFDQK